MNSTFLHSCGSILITCLFLVGTKGLFNSGHLYAVVAPHSSHFTDTTYTFSKRHVATIKSQISFDRISSDSLSTLFTSLLTQHLIPHWLSTPWSFEGHTDVPRQGTIACGYFVSTTLRDMGFNLNRYKFAQQLPIYEAKTLSLGEPLIEINLPSPQARIDELQRLLQEGIYFIGFDQSHVGYIHRTQDEVFVIHSNYINAEGVIIEKVETSEVFAVYETIYIAPISTNPALMQKWINSSPLEIITQ